VAKSDSIVSVALSLNKSHDLSGGRYPLPFTAQSAAWCPDFPPR